jgi:hypothetical protein
VGNAIAAAAADREVEAYPAPPWALSGQAHGHLLVVRAGRLPDVPDGFDPLVFGGFGLVATAWVDYREGTVDPYRELMAAVVGRWRGRLTATVTHMWVDSDVSRRGGRELWGYPKEMAEFEVAIDPEGTANARDERGEIASGDFRAWFTSPLRTRAKGGTVQPVDGQMVAIPAITSLRLAIGTGSFRAAPDGPLGFLACARRIASFGAGDFRTEFGWR